MLFSTYNDVFCMTDSLMFFCSSNFSQHDIDYFLWNKTMLQCHKAKNLIPEAGGQPTRTGEAVLELQVDT